MCFCPGLAQLQEAVEEGGGREYQETALDPRFRTISDHPAFTALLERMTTDVGSMRARTDWGKVDLGFL